MKKFYAVIALTLGLLLSTASHADVVKAAVAANFTAAVRQLAPLFERKTGHQLLASFGSTGQLYAQINNGAPFDVFLAADDVKPGALIKAGSADPGSHFIYARGRLALWSPQPGYVDADGKVLATGSFAKIAVANPKTAPYGAAAFDTLAALHLLDKLRPRFVMGENIAQTQQFVASGNVPLGFVALAQVRALPPAQQGSYWVVPEHLHKPIEQGAVMLKSAANPAGAADFLAFLKSPEAVAIIRRLGYQQ